MNNKVISLRKGQEKIKTYKIICEILNTFLPLEKKVLILTLGLFGNKSHTDLEMVRLLNESKEDIQKSREIGIQKLIQKIY